jgi:hypothetical protein
MTRWTRFPLAGAVGLVVLAITPPALADEPCSIVDLTCVVEEAAEDAEGIIDEITDPVDDTTDPIVQPILDEVDAILGRGGLVDPPDGGGGGGGGGGSNGGGGSGPGAGHGGSRPPISSTTTQQQIFDPALGASPGVARPRGVEDAQPVSSGGIGPILTGAARSVLLLLVLLGISLGFVLIQDRLDRNEPKLALARISPDVLGFE